ncbi:MAG: proline iminopeptidase-family hydrolase [Bdellovibrionota bacterium]
MNLASVYQLLLGCGRKFARFEKNQATSFDGRIPVSGGSIHYWKFGYSDRFPLILIHGGPGFPHNYLLPLKVLSDERMVIFYDQLGCGASDRPTGNESWAVERFVDELRTLASALKIPKFHLLGHSWGAILALECAFGDPRVASVTLASPCISIPKWTGDARKLRALLPGVSREALERAERTGDYQSEDVRAAEAEYYARFVYGAHPYQSLVDAGAAKFGKECYRFMWGPNEAAPTGTLRGYDRSDALSDLRIPALYTCGRNDEATPETTAWYCDRTPNARMRVFELSAHMPHLSETVEYCRELRKFFDDVEGHAHG